MNYELGNESLTFHCKNYFHDLIIFLCQNLGGGKCSPCSPFTYAHGQWANICTWTIFKISYQTYTNILEGRMIQLPRRAVTFSLIIHRRQYLKTRSSLKLLPDSVRFVTCLCRVYRDTTKHINSFLKHIANSVPSLRKVECADI